jgi:hypothetical protein
VAGAQRHLLFVWPRELLLGGAALSPPTERLVGDAESSLGDAKSSLGDSKSSLGDAESSLGGR